MSHVGRLDAERLRHLRQAAEIGIRMCGLQPHTIHVVPTELAAMIDEITERRATPDNADVVMLAAERQELLNEVAVLRRHLSEREQAMADMRATMVATRRAR